MRISGNLDLFCHLPPPPLIPQKISSPLISANVSAAAVRLSSWQLYLHALQGMRVVTPSTVGTRSSTTRHWRLLVSTQDYLGSRYSSTQTADADARQAADAILSVAKAHQGAHEAAVRASVAAADDAPADESQVFGDARFPGVVGALCSGFVERETEASLLLLAALTSEHLLLLGPPGTAKSALANRLASLDASSETPFFARLLSRFTTPEELFGPLSLAALERDAFERLTAGYLPTARVAFLDEVFNASSSVLNSLLGVLNERLFGNGVASVRVPLLCLVAASNAVPPPGELDALYDRFLLRRFVSPLSDGGLAALLQQAPERSGESAPSGAPSAAPPDNIGRLLTRASLDNFRSDASALPVSPGAMRLLADARDWASTAAAPHPPAGPALGARGEGGGSVSSPDAVGGPSDRRMGKALRAARAAAFACGAIRVEPPHLLVLRHVLWDAPEQEGALAEWLMERCFCDPSDGELCSDGSLLPPPLPPSLDHALACVDDGDDAPSCPPGDAGATLRSSFRALCAPSFPPHPGGAAALRSRLDSLASRLMAAERAAAVAASRSSRIITASPWLSPPERRRMLSRLRGGSGGGGGGGSIDAAGPAASPPLVATSAPAPSSAGGSSSVASASRRSDLTDALVMRAALDARCPPPHQPPLQPPLAPSSSFSSSLASPPPDAAPRPPGALLSATLLPHRWAELARAARDAAHDAVSLGAGGGRLRAAIPHCGHRIARAACPACLEGLGLGA